MPWPAESAGRFSLRIARSMAGLAELGDWMDQVSAALGLDRATEYALRLCAEEAAANLVMHAEACEGDADLVTLCVAAVPEALDLIVEDHCAPFDPRTVAAPALPRSAAEARVGGMGIHLMRHYAQAIRYERVGDANRLTLRLAPVNARGERTEQGGDRDKDCPSA